MIFGALAGQLVIQFGSRFAAVDFCRLCIRWHRGRSGGSHHPQAGPLRGAFRVGMSVCVVAVLRRGFDESGNTL